MGDCVGENWRWKSYLGIDLTYKLKSPVSAAKYIFLVLLRKNGSSGELGHQGFLTLLMAEYAFFMFVTVGEDAFGEEYVLKFCERTYSEVWQGKPRVVAKSDQVSLYMITRFC